MQMKQLKCPKCGKIYNRFKLLFILSNFVCQNCGGRISLRIFHRTGLFLILLTGLIGYYQPKNVGLIIFFTWLIFGLFDAEITISDKEDSKQNLWQNKLFLTLVYILLFFFFLLTIVK